VSIRGSSIDYVLVVGHQEVLVTDDEDTAVAAFGKHDEALLYLVTSTGVIVEWAATEGWVIKFRPGAPSQGNAFGTWPEVQAVLHDIAPCRKPVTITIDDSSAPAIIPPGTTIVGSGRLLTIKGVGLKAPLSWSDKCTLVDLHVISDNAEAFIGSARSR
jgi:hypothetical protein